MERESNISQIIISGRCTSLFGFPRLSVRTASGYRLVEARRMRRANAGRKGKQVWEKKKERKKKNKKKKKGREERKPPELRNEPFIHGHGKYINKQLEGNLGRLLHLLPPPLCTFAEKRAKEPPKAPRRGRPLASLPVA